MASPSHGSGGGAYSILREKGTMPRPLLGVQPRRLTPELIAGLHLKATRGVLVEDVAPGGPGAEAGLQPGHALPGLARKPIHNIRHLFRVEYELAPDRPLDSPSCVAPNRARFASHPPPRKALQRLSIPEYHRKDNLVFRLGLYGATLTPALASGLDLVRDSSGVLVIARAGQGLSGRNPLQPALY